MPTHTMECLWSNKLCQKNLRKMAIDTSASDDGSLQKKPISFQNLAIGAALNVFEVSTLGQPFEVSLLHPTKHSSPAITAVRDSRASGKGDQNPNGCVSWGHHASSYSHSLVPWRHFRLLSRVVPLGSDRGLYKRQRVAFCDV